MSSMAFNVDNMKARFLAELAKAGSVAAAALALGIDRSNAYKWRRADSSFAAAWDDALLEAAEHLEQVAYQRAVHGVEEPVYYKGEICGSVRRYDNTLLWNLLKASNPAKYRETAAVQVDLGDDLVARLNAGRQRVGRSPG